MYFQFQPVGTQRFTSQLSRKNRFFRRFRTGGIGQQGNASIQQRCQNGVAVMAQIDALERQRHQLAAAFTDGIHHQLRRGEFSGPGKQM